MIKPLVAGNWKMNGLATSSSEIKSLDEKLAAAASPKVVMYSSAHPQP